MMNKDITRFKRLICEDKTLKVNAISGESLETMNLIEQQLKQKLPNMIVSLVLNIFFWYFLYRYASAGLLQPGFNHIVLYFILTLTLNHLFEKKYDNFYFNNKIELENVAINKTTNNKLIGYYEKLVNDYEGKEIEKAGKYLFKMYHIASWLSTSFTFLFYLGVFFCMYLRCSGYGNPSFFLFIAILVLNTLSTKLINKLVIKIYKNYSKGGR